MAERNYGLLRSAEKFEAFVKRIISTGLPFGLDIETGYKGKTRSKVSLQTYNPDWLMVGFSFTNSLEWARYVPIAHDCGDNVDDPKQAAKALWRMLQTGLGVMHNVSFEYKCLSKWFRDLLWDDPEVGQSVREADGNFPFLSDSQVEAFLTGFYSPQKQGLKALTEIVFEHRMIHLEDLLPAKAPGALDKVRFNTFELDTKTVTYACEDSVWCLAHHFKHYPEVKDSFIYKVEMELIPVFYRMEREGLLLDWDEIARKERECSEFRDRMNEEIQQMLSDRLGETVSINLGSTKQLGEFLFNRLGLPVTIRSEKTNEPSTSEKALRAIAKADPVVQRILEYREVSKLLTSYLHKYTSQLHYDPTGRARPNHKQTGAATGRISVDEVSYQQWPKPYHYTLADGTEFYMNFRNLLISPPGTRLIGFDFSQVELRVLAGLANEQIMLKAFRDGVDIHSATASAMMRKPIEEVTEKDRAKGKTLGFATVYQSGPENIASMLTRPDDPVTTEDAERMLETYYAGFPALRPWMDSKIAEGHQQGYVTTLFGRRFTVWELQDPKRWVRTKGDRLCINAPVQGGAADYCKVAMVRADKAIRNAGLQDKIKMVMMVHDSLDFYVDNDVDTQAVLDLLGPAVSFPVPSLPEIIADWHEGLRWGELVELDRDADGKISGYSRKKEHFSTIQEAYDFIEAQRGSSQPVEAILSDLEEDLVSPEPRKERNSLVTISQMPNANQWDLFQNFLTRMKTEGPAGVTLITPEGAITFPHCALSSEDQPSVSALLGGASLTFEDEHTDCMEDIIL